MPLIIILLLALLIAQIGFWNALAAILGAVGMVILLIIIAAGIIITGGLLVARSVNRRIDPPGRNWR